MPSQTTVTTSLPSGVHRQAVISAMHDHDRYIHTTCPQLVEYNKLSGTPGVGFSCVYEVTDKRPIGKTTFTLTLMNRDDGISATIDGKAPTGAIHVESKWTVYEDRVEEDVNINANMIMNKMIKGNVEKSHPEQHKSFFQTVRA